MTLRKVAAALVAVGLVIGLIGAGISAQYTDGASAAQNVNVGTFGIEISSAVGVVAPDKHSVTFTAPEIVSSAPSSAPFIFTVKSTGSVAVNIHITQTVPVAPFASLLASPADAVLGLNDTHDYAGGLSWPMLVNADLSKTATITYTAVATEGGATVVAIAPVVVLKACSTNLGGITIPAVANLDYSVAGTPVAAGFNQRNLGAYQVTAVAMAGHPLTGYPAGGWSLTVAELASCRPITITVATAYAWNNDLYGYKTTLSPAPVIDNVARTVTYVIPITTASTTVQPGMTGGQPFLGNYQYTSTGTTITVLASATVSSGLTSQASKFNLVYRNSTMGLNYTTIAPLNVTGRNLVTLANRHNGGVGASSDNAPGVTWSGVTGTGTVTIVLSFSATTP